MGLRTDTVRAGGAPPLEEDSRDVCDVAADGHLHAGLGAREVCGRCVGGVWVVGGGWVVGGWWAVGVRGEVCGRSVGGGWVVGGWWVGGGQLVGGWWVDEGES